MVSAPLQLALLPLPSELSRRRAVVQKVTKLCKAEGEFLSVHSFVCWFILSQIMGGPEVLA